MQTALKLYSISEAAQLLGVSAETLRRWERSGKIAVGRTPTGNRIFTDEDILRLKNGFMSSEASQNGDVASHIVSTNSRNNLTQPYTSLSKIRLNSKIFLISLLIFISVLSTATAVFTLFKFTPYPNQAVLGVETYIAPVVEEATPLLRVAAARIGSFIDFLKTRGGNFAVPFIGKDNFANAEDLKISGKASFEKDVQIDKDLKVNGTAYVGRLKTGIVDPYLIENDGDVQSFLEIRTKPSALGSADIVFEPGGIEKLRIREGGTVKFSGSIEGIENITATGEIKGGSLSIGGNTFSGTKLTFSGSSPSIYPSTTNTGISLNGNGTGAINIGNSGTGDVYIAGGSGDSGCTITNNNGSLACSSDITSSANIIGRHFRPSTSALYDLGSSDTRFRNAYFSGTITVGSSTTTIDTSGLSTGTVTASSITGSGQLTLTRSPSSAHTGTWAIGSSTWNQSDATIYVNPASATADSNIFALAVGGSVKFDIDAEGDVYANNLILTGSTTQASTTVSGTLSVEGNTTLGDATTDTLTINTATLTWAGGNKTIDITGAATRTLTILNSTASQVADLDLSDGVYKIGGVTGKTVSACGASQYLGGVAVTGGIITTLGSCTTVSSAWSGLTDPTTNLSLTMAANTTTLTYNAATGTGNLFKLIDTLNNTGTGYLLDIETASGSNVKPFTIVARGQAIIDTTAAGVLTLGNSTLAQNVQFFSSSNTITSAGALTIAGALTGSSTVQGTRLISTISTGTAPLTVTSTTAVTNLNADLLDGMDSTAFGDATAANQTTILTRIGTNADAAGTTTLFARLARIDDTDLGATADAGSSSGSVFARLTEMRTLVDDLETRLTAGRATNLDNLDAAISSRYARPQAATYHQVATNAGLTELTVILDTGALAAGEYEVFAFASHKAVGTSVIYTVAIQHRDAANTGNVKQVALIKSMSWDSASGAGGPSVEFHWPRITVAANERIRLIKIDGGDAGSPSQDHMLFVRPI